MAPTEPAVPETADAPRINGHDAASATDQPIAMQLKIATWTRLSLKKSSRPPRRDSRKVRRASSPSQPSSTECATNKSPPTTCVSGAEDRKNGAAAKPTSAETIVI